MRIARRSPGVRGGDAVRRALAAIALAAMVGSLSLAAGDEQEVAVKAAMLFNFAKFAEWPPPAPTAPLMLCVAGDDEIAAALGEIVLGQKIGGRAVEARRPLDPDEWGTCQLLFVGDKVLRGGSLAAIQNLPVLTVSDVRGFADNHGIIELYVEGGRMRFAINIDAAARAGVVLSSRLLSLARIVRRGRAD